jgi:hypothetical protein
MLSFREATFSWYKNSILIGQMIRSVREQLYNSSATIDIEKSWKMV